MGTQVFTVICALLAILGLIFLFFWLYSWLRKKLGGGSFGNFGGGKNIRIRECISVAQDKQLLIVTVGSRTMLIGVTAGSMQKLCDLDEGDLFPEQEPGTEVGGFMQNLRTAIAQRGQGAGVEELERMAQEEHAGQEVGQDAGQDVGQDVGQEVGQAVGQEEEKGAKEDRRNEE